jgi:hypothetical protein
MTSGNHDGSCRRQRHMIRSRRLVLASLVFALGFTACGDPSTTTPLASKPPVIQLAGGQTGSSGGGPMAANAPADASTESKIAFMGQTTFVYDGTPPALDDPAGSWFFPSGQKADPDRIAKLAASLGVVGDVRALSADQGGGWAVGPEDYSSAVLSVSSDGMLSWYLSPTPTAVPDLGCSSSSGVVTEPAPAPPAPAARVDVSLPVDNAASAAEAPAATVPAETVAAGTDAVAPDAIPAPDCGTPNPPANVPSKDEALAKAKQLFADWGYDINSYQFDDPYADEWGASVNASLLLDGHKAPILLSVGFGENGALTYASGSLATPQRGADYPTIGAAAGLDRLKTQQNQYGVETTGVMKTTDDVSTGGGVAVPAVAPDTAIAAPACEPAAATDCPTDVTPPEPVTVTLNSVKADLTMVWAADNTIWLLPAYTFGTADGALYTVIAVEDAFIHQADPTSDTTPPGAIDPGVVAVPSPDTTGVAVTNP